MIEKHDAGWFLGGGWELSQIVIDHRLTLIWTLEGHSFQVVVENPFLLVRRDGARFSVDPERKESLRPLLDLFGEQLADAYADETDGSLGLALVDGGRIEVATHPKYESWELNAPGTKLIGLPGGEIAVFQS